MTKGEWKQDGHEGECLDLTGIYSVPASNIQNRGMQFNPLFIVSCKCVFDWKPESLFYSRYLISPESRVDDFFYFFFFFFIFFFFFFFLHFLMSSDNQEFTFLKLLKRICFIHHHFNKSSSRVISNTSQNTFRYCSTVQKMNDVFNVVIKEIGCD